ncbi:MAG TPA: diacylglycerol kinase family protein [Arthrobacter sp.]|nr:diacylglycerol kinase family protein [Arthrobacter sp.]
MRIAVAINARASSGSRLRAGAEVVDYFRAAGMDVLELRESSFARLGSAVDRALAASVDALVVVGGDGMVHLAVNALAGSGGLGSRVPLGIVRTGTGNDAARTLALPLNDVEAACRRITAGMAAGGRPVDLGRISADAGTRWFAGALSAGFDASVNDRGNRWRWPRGKARYNLAMLRELATFRAIEYTVTDYTETDDGVSWQQRAMLISIANGQSIGGGMRITPDARLDDGMLDLFVVSPLSRARFLAVFPKVFTGRHVGHPAVEIRQVRKVRLSARNVTAYADGERIGPLPLTVEVDPGAVRILA